MKPEWTELRDRGQSPGQLADRWLVREVWEEGSFHDDLEAGDWQRADDGEWPSGTRTGMGRNRVCVIPRCRSFGWRKRLDFQSTVVLSNCHHFCPHLGRSWGFLLGPGTGPKALWPGLCLSLAQTPSKTYQNPGPWAFLFPFCCKVTISWAPTMC